MKKALVFRNNEEQVVVSAEDVLAGKFERTAEFVDPEYQYKLTFVKGAKHGGGPYFRLYYSYEDYKKLFPKKADRYKMIADMRHYKQSKWHREWEQAFKPFCSIEECVENLDSKTKKKKWKIADACFVNEKICLEFQHSYIAQDFKERNHFYESLGYRVIWVFDLTGQEIRENADGNLDILENNSRGFFRITEAPLNLRDFPVFVQMKNGIIYRVKKLSRRDSSTSIQSTIRFFKPEQRYKKEEFVEAVRQMRLPEITPMSLTEIWKNVEEQVVVKNIKNDKYYLIRKSKYNDGPHRDPETRCIQYRYWDPGWGSVSYKYYSIGLKEEQEPCWIVFRCS